MRNDKFLLSLYAVQIPEEIRTAYKYQKFLWKIVSGDEKFIYYKNLITKHNGSQSVIDIYLKA